MGHAGVAGLFGDQRPDINISWPIGCLASQSGANIGRDLIAAATDSWPDVDVKLVRRESGASEHADRLLDDTRFGAPPP